MPSDPSLVEAVARFVRNQIEASARNRQIARRRSGLKVVQIVPGFWRKYQDSIQAGGVEVCACHVPRPGGMPEDSDWLEGVEKLLELVRLYRPHAIVCASQGACAPWRCGDAGYGRRHLMINAFGDLETLPDGLALTIAHGKKDPTSVYWTSTRLVSPDVHRERRHVPTPPHRRWPCYAVPATAATSASRQGQGQGHGCRSGRAP